jgi:hypothetical protein
MTALEIIMKYTRHLTTSCLLAGILALAISSALPNPAWAQLALQPADLHSTLPDANLSYIRDDDFAKLMQDNLIKRGNSYVKDASSCFRNAMAAACWMICRRPSAA